MFEGYFLMLITLKMAFMQRENMSASPLSLRRPWRHAWGVLCGGGGVHTSLLALANIFHSSFQDTNYDLLLYLFHMALESYFHRTL